MSAFKKQLVKDLSTMFCHYVEPTNSIQNVEDKLKCRQTFFFSSWDENDFPHDINHRLSYCCCLLFL